MHPFSFSFHLGGIAGVRSLSIIRRCRASGIAKLACYPGCCRCRRPPLSMFFESRLKKRRSRLHFGAFLHLEDFLFGEKWIFTKILHTAGVLAFFGDLGGVKKSSKNKGNSPKSHGSGKAVFGDGFWTIFEAFVCQFQSAKHCKIQCFCTFCVERQQRQNVAKTP